MGEAVALKSPGGPPGLPTATNFPPSPKVAARASVADVGSTTVNLRSGWNALGLQCATVSSLSSSASIAGLAFYEGGAYQTRSFTQAELNGGQAGRRGLWVFANAATTFTYSGQDDSLGKTLSLQAGWNLISSAQPTPVKDLVAKVDGVQVPLGTVILTTVNQINDDNTYTSLDLGTGGALPPGRACWMYAAVPVTLSWATAQPSPSPTPTPMPTAEGSPSPAAAASPIIIYVPVPVGNPQPPAPAPSASPTPTPSPSPSPNPSPTAELSITAGPTTATAGATFNVQVTVLDGSSQSVELSVSGPSGTTLGGYAGPVTATGGVATFNGLTLNKSGSVTLNADATGYSGAARTVTVSSAAASKLVYAASDPTTVTAGASFDLTLYGMDNYDNLDTTFTGSVSLGLDPGFGGQPAGQELAGGGTRTAASGEVTFTGLSLKKTALGGLLAQSSGKSSAARTLTVTAGAAAALSFAQNPPGGTAGQNLDGTVVEVVDSQGNLVSGHPATAVTLSVETGTSGAVFTPSSPSNTTVAGSTRYSGLKLDRAGAYRLRATAPGGLTGLSGTFNVAAATGNRLVIRTLPTTLQASVDSPVDAVVEIQDSLGQLVIDDNNTLVALSHSDYQAAEGAATGSVKLGALTSQVQARASAGVATFSVQKLHPNFTGSYDIQATASGLLADARGGIVVSPGPANKLLFTVQPTSTVASEFAFIAPVVELVIRDASNNLKTDATGTVSLALSAGTTQLFGNTGAAMSGGKASFPQLRATTLALGNKLRATVTGLSGTGDPSSLDSADSNVFDVRLQQILDNTSGFELSQQSVSSNGRYVAFTTSFTLVPQDNNGEYDLYRLDRQTGLAELVSCLANGTAAGLSDTVYYSISPNGNKLSYNSYQAAHLIDPQHAAGSYDALGYRDVFVRDMSTPPGSPQSTVVASYASDNGMRSGDCYSNSVNDSGEVAFVSSHQIAPPGLNYADGIGNVYPYKRTATGLVSLSATGNDMWRTHADRSIAITNAGDVAFVCLRDANALDATISADTNGTWDVFLFVQGGPRRCVSRTGGAGSTAGNRESYRWVSITRTAPGGSPLVAFSSYASNFGGTIDGNGNEDVFVGGGLTAPVVVDAIPGNPNRTSNVNAYFPSISDDGNLVAFVSQSSNLVAGDTGSEDVFVRDIAAQQTTRVSVSASGGQLNNGSFQTAIAGNGSYVAFRTYASNVAAGLTGGLFGALR